MEIIVLGILGTKKFKYEKLPWLGISFSKSFKRTGNTLELLSLNQKKCLT